jgi:release factor glutamine methyltransferase
MRAIIDIYGGAVKVLAAGRVPSPENDAAIIISEATGLRRSSLIIEKERSIGTKTNIRVQDMVKRRASGEPLQYITGKTWFRHLTLATGPGALIPRPETELLVDLALTAAPKGAALCDLGTGSGAVALSAAQERPDIFVTAVEISPAAIRIAASNRKNAGLRNIVFVNADLMSAFPERPLFDVVTANLPYVTEAEYKTLPGEILLHEPQTALLGGRDGLDIIRRAIPETALRLREGGLAIFETGSNQTEETARIFEASGLYGTPAIHEDLNRKKRFVSARRRPGHKNAP